MLSLKNIIISILFRRDIKTAEEFAEKILQACAFDIRCASKMTTDIICNVSKTGRKKLSRKEAAALQAAFCFSCHFVEREKKPIRCSRDAAQILLPALCGLQVEQFHVIVLDRKNEVLKTLLISEGGTTGTVVDTKVLFSRVLGLMSNNLPVSAIVLCHNHPSGNLTPSESDLALTKKIVEAALLLDLKVLDHIIIGGNNYLSFGDEGYL
jgi:DNA repair protein RadC